MDKGTQEEEDEGRAKKPQSGVAVIGESSPPLVFACTQGLRLLASVPLSQGGLPRIGPLDVTTVEGRAMTVIELMERLVGTDMQLVLNVEALLKVQCIAFLLFFSPFSHTNTLFFHRTCNKLIWNGLLLCCCVAIQKIPGPSC